MLDPGLIKLGAKAASLPAKHLLQKLTFRWRVARASSAEARRQGIDVTALAVRKWLRRPDSQDQISQGSSTHIASAVARLALVVGGTDREAAAATLLAIILREILAAHEPSRATAIASGWLDTTIKAESEKTRSLIEEFSAPRLFQENVRRLHPWRAEEASALRAQWPEVSEAVQVLANADDPGLVLAQWYADLPEIVAGSPVDALRWLGFIAADYKAVDAAVGFLTRAIDRGAYPADYLWARAALAVDEEQRARELLEQVGTASNALAAALRLQFAGKDEEAVKVLEGWNPTTPNDVALKAIVLSNSYVRLKQMGRAIGLLVDEAESEPGASGPALGAAQLMLNRGRFGKSESPYQDYERALSLALRARNARRSWRGDSVSATLVAVQAAALSGDTEHAIRLTIAEPEGDATTFEAADNRLGRERAILLAMAGKPNEALATARDLGDPFASAVVAGFNALSSGDRATGTQQLLDAFRRAEQDADKLLVASALVADGDSLPDLTSLASEYPEQVDEFRRHHAYLTAGADRLQLLRAHVHESPRLAIALADIYVKDGQQLDAARIIEKSAIDFTLPALMTTAAHHYLRSGAPEEAVRACETAIAMAAGSWAGEFLTRTVFFDALASQNRFDEAVQQARRLVSLDPYDPSARWALAQSLLRQGDLDGAWAAIAPNSDPIDPRSPHEARLWIGLAVKSMKPAVLVPRALNVMRRWPDDEELLGIFHGHLIAHLPSGDLDQKDIDDLNQAREGYLQRFPNSKTLRAVKFDVDSEDPLESLVPELKARYEAIHGLAQQVREGQLPQGTLSMASSTYASVLLQRVSGQVRSHDPQLATQRATQLPAVIGRSVAIDTTAIVTLSMLEDATVTTLVGQFAELHTSDEAYRDALAAQEEAATRSTLSLAWDPSTGAPRATETSEDEAELVADQANRVAGFFARTWKHPRPDLHSFPKLQDRALGWLATLDYAIEHRLPFWCDDSVFARFAEAQGVMVFGSVDLLRHITATGDLMPDVSTVAEAMLIHNFHVDLGFRAPVMEHAAELAGWAPEGAAFALTRSNTWVSPEPTATFLDKALLRAANRGPDALQGWISCAALGLVADLEPAEGSSNLRVLLGRLLAQPWFRTDLIPFIFGGVRHALDTNEELADPVADVLREHHSAAAERHGHEIAQLLLLALVAHAGDGDKSIATRIILTAD